MKRKYLNDQLKHYAQKYAKGTRGVSKRIVKGVLANAGLAAAAGVAERFIGPSNKGFASYSKGAGTWTKKLGGRRRNFKSRKVKAIGTVKPKGITSKFISKVNKAVAFTGHWGLHTVTDQVQLRQITIDQWNIVSVNEMSIQMEFGTPNDILNSASVLYNAKTDVQNPDTLTGNFPVAGLKLEIVDYKVDFFFKSTSSHVVNIELYECTAKSKVLAAFNVYSYVTNSYNGDYNDLLYQQDAAFAVTNRTMSANDLNSTAKEWTELLKEYSVKKRVIKLQPGDHTTHSIRVFGSKVLDYSNECLENAGVCASMKGTKCIFFRIINDPTVSAGTGQIHAFPSSAQGGVACRYTKSIRIKPPAPMNLTLSNYRNQNIIRRAEWFRVDGASTDQQVVINNPINSTTILT